MCFSLFFCFVVDDELEFVSLLKNNVLLYTNDLIIRSLVFIGVVEVILIVNFMEVIRINVRRIFVFLLIVIANNFMEIFVEHSVKVSLSLSTEAW